MQLDGIDTSNWQKDIRLSALPKLDLAIFKASQGTDYPDAYFEGFVKQARDLGIERVGAYWWVESHLPIKAQLDVFLRKVEPYLPDLTLYADWEPRNPERVDVAAEAIAQLKAATGAQPHIYMNRSTAHRYPWQPVRDLGCHLWMAQYAHTSRVDGFQDSPWHQPPSGWDGRLMGLQYTDKGRLPGYEGNLDLNRFWYWPESSTPQEPPMTIPTLRENDPPVDLVNSHGETLRSSNGAPRKACLCMALTFPLIEQEMIRRGLIKRTIDVFQAGYNKGKVAASAGTHDMGGVIDVAQGITLEQRRVWAEFGVMMFPRTRQYGWTTGDHGHGVWHGCPHQSISADQQVRSGIAGRDGLVSNLVRNFEAPKRTWQDAYRAATTIKPSPTRPPLEDDMPESKRHAQTLTPNGRDWTVTDAVVLPSDGPAKASARGTVTVPADVTVTTRWVSFHGKGGDGWWRDTVVTHSPGTVETTVIVDQASPADLRLDVKTDKPCEARVELTAQVWRK